MNQTLTAGALPAVAERRQGKLRDPAREYLVERGHPARQQVEDFIAWRFLKVHGARVSAFMPTLLALIDDDGEVRAALGVRDAGVEIEFQGGEASCEIRGDEALLSSLVSNLVDNAIKYGGRGSRVRVHCARDSYGWRLTVEDSGAGLDAGQREKVLQRFYRAGADGSAGAGLGLSIVKTIADLHGAGVELDESALGGLRVAVRFDR